MIRQVHRISIAALLSLLVIALIKHSSDNALRSLRRRLSGPPYADIFPRWDETKYMIQLSDDIYNIEDGGNPRDAITDDRWDFKLWIIASFSTEAMILKSKEADGKVVVIFRGSEETDDWLANFNIIQEPSKFVNAPSDVELHSGFQGALFDVNPLTIEDTTSRFTKSSYVVTELENEVLNLVGTSGEFWVTGHSLG